MKNSPIAFALYCNREFVLVLVLASSRLFPVETMRLGRQTSQNRTHSISQISDSRFQN
jgi:hypothetical protein